MDLGAISLNINYKDKFIANGSLSPLYFGLGSNNYSANATYFQYDKDGEEGREFFSRFLRGQASSVTLTGSTASTPIRVLQPAMAQLTSPAVLPGLPVGLIARAKLDFSFEIFSGKIPARFNILNPFSVQIAVVSAAFKAFLNNVYIGYMEQNFTDPIIIAANSTTTTPQIDIYVAQINLAELEALVGDV